MDKSATQILAPTTILAGETTTLASSTVVDNSRATQLDFTVEGTFHASATGGLTAYLYSSTDNVDFDDKYFDYWEIDNCRKIGFDSGSSMFVIGETITSASSGTGVVVNWSLDSGTFAGTDAAGFVFLENISGTFANDDQLDGSISGANCATEDGAIVAHSVHRTYYPTTVCPAYYKIRIANDDTGQSATLVSVTVMKQTI